MIEKKFNFIFSCKFVKILVVKTLDPDWIRISIQPKMLDPDLYQTNTDPKPCKDDLSCMPLGCSLSLQDEGRVEERRKRREEVAGRGDKKHKYAEHDDR